MCGDYGNQPIAMPRASDRSFLLKIVDSQGAPLDLTGATVTFSLKLRLGSPAPLLAKDSSDVTKINVFDPTNGYAYVIFKPSDTAAFPAQRYYYDIWVTLADGEKYEVVPVSWFVVEQPATVFP